MEISNTQKWLINQKLNRIRLSVKNINLGGCGLFAYHMYDVLKNRGIEPQILVFHYEGDGPKENPIHIIVKLQDGSYLDSRGFFNTQKDILKYFINFDISEMDGDKLFRLSPISKTELENMLTNVKWNKAFDYFFVDNNFKTKSNKELLVESIKKEFYGL